MLKVKIHLADFVPFVRSRSFAAALMSIMLALCTYSAANLVCYASTSVDGISQSEDGEDGKDGEDAATEASQPDSKPKVSANKHFAVYVVENGEKRKVMIKGGTVADVFTQIELTLSKYDNTDIPLETVVKSGDVITVTRTRYNTVEIRKQLPFETIACYSPEISPGVEKVLVEGEDGVQFQTVRQTIVDGAVIDETVKDFVVEKEPVNRKVLMGFPVKPVSSYDFGFDFDENCEPIGYVNVLRSQKSAGYNAPAGAYTASGMKAAVGHVAVDPNVIPYGTKLFIISSDGKHIYGYAIAADTGTSLKNGRIAVDLFYNTYKESADNGIRNVDIFILEEPLK